MVGIKRKPIVIQVIVNEDGTLNVETQMYKMEGIARSDINSITTPFAGLSVEFQLDCADKELKNEIILKLQEQAGWGFYLNSDHPGLVNYFTNLLNLDQKKHTIDSLKGIAKDKAIVICGAGSSLADNFDTIKKLIKEDKAIVIAGGSAIRYFSDMKVNPHFCLAFDPFDAEFDLVFSKLDTEWMKNNTLICYHSLNIKCYEMWQGRMVTIGGQSCFIDRQAVDQLTHINEGGVGVSTAMVVLSAFMKAKESYLVGVDLAYKDKNLTKYADGRTQADAELEHQYTAPETVNVDGIYTTTQWQHECGMLGTIINMLGLKIYNCSTHGLTIAGVTRRSLKKVLKRPSKEISFTLDKVTDEQLKAIRLNCSTMRQGLELIDKLGAQAKEVKGTFAYTTLIAMYDFLQRYREIWTYRYDDTLIRKLSLNLANAIKKAQDNNKS